jgi:hypothetical protein
MSISTAIRADFSVDIFVNMTAYQSSHILYPAVTRPLIGSMK